LQGEKKSWRADSNRGPADYESAIRAFNRFLFAFATIRYSTLNALKQLLEAGF